MGQAIEMGSKALAITQPASVGGECPDLFVVKQKKGSAATVYQRGDLIGKGSSADVHEGVDLSSGRRVAIKVFRAGSPEREMRIHARLNHPNIIPLLGYGFAGEDDDPHGGTPFLVTPFAENGTLGRLIPPNGMPVEEVMRYIDGIAKGVIYLHRRNLVHGDIKPSNVASSNDPSGENIWVMDFGLTTPPHTHPPIGQAFGFTLKHAAPEQFEGKGTWRTDVYNLASTAYTLLTCSSAFDGSSVEEYAQAKRRGARVPFPDMLGGTPRSVAIGEVLDQGMHPDPRMRPSVRRFVQKLDQASQVSDTRNPVIIP